MKTTKIVLSCLLGIAPISYATGIFKRIDQTTLKGKQEQLVTTFQQDTIKRKYILGGACAASIALGAALLLYRSRHRAMATPPILKPDTIEGLCQRVSIVETFIKKFSFGENIQSSIFNWTKSISYHLFWFFGPMLAVEAIKGRALQAKEYLETAFYTPSIEWVVQHQARLGRLIYVMDITEIPTEVLVEGQILAELMHSADVCKAHRDNATLCPLARTRFEEAWADVLDALIITLSYMHLRIDACGPQPGGAFSLLDRADRLTKYTNELSSQLERILEKPNEYGNLPDMTRRFKSELEKQLVAFKYLEMNATCIPTGA